MNTKQILRFKTIAMWLALLFAISLTLSATSESSECRKPKISVPGAISDDYGYHQVREGNVQVYCSSDSNKLVFEAAETVYTDVVNETTIKGIIVPSFRTVWVKCIDSNECSDFAWININYNPNVTNFHCFSNNLDTLNCSWNSNSLVNNYSLTLHSSWYKNVKCKGLINSRRYYSCLWDLSGVESLHDPHRRPLQVSVQLQMCNIFECIYKTKDLDLIKVTKLNAPYIHIEASGTTSASLTWSLKFGSLTLPSLIEIYYVIEYAIPGTEPRVLISDTAEFSRYEPFTNELTLPCPGKQYTVRLSCRFLDSPQGYTSDFAYTSVRTEPDINATVLDPICKITPVEINPHVMKYKDQLLRQKVEFELNKQEKRKRGLKEKVTLIKKIQLLLSDGNM